MSAEIKRLGYPRCPVCGAQVDGMGRQVGRVAEMDPPDPPQWWSTPCGCKLTGVQYAALSGEMREPLWRFDVPEVPAHVTALQSVERIYELDDHRWVRMPGDRWAPVWPDGRIGTARLSLIALAAYAPLVECEDPRAAS